MTYDDPDPSQPARQRQVVVVAAVVLALLAVVGAAVLLTGGDDDGLATPAPSPSPSPSPTSSPSPSPSPEPSPSPSPEPDTWEPAEAFLTPEQADAAEQVGWEPADFAETQGSLLDPCGGDDVPVVALVQARDEQALFRPTETGGVELLQQVLRYESEQDAATALSTYLQRVEDCPRTPVEGVDDEQENTVVVEASGEDRLLVRSRYCNPACTDLFTTYAMVARAGTGLTVARYAMSDDGDPAEGAPALLDALAAALQSAATP